jgi:hypothetical protein
MAEVKMLKIKGLLTRQRQSDIHWRHVGDMCEYSVDKRQTLRPQLCLYLTQSIDS